MNSYTPLSFQDKQNSTSGKVAWQSPSNIALVKYWGKYGRQLPRNTSISFTLKNAHTDMKMSYVPKKGDVAQVILYFEEERNTAFEARIAKFIASIDDIYPFLQELDLEIYSSNSFPHSAGIASSASAMSALACCLCSIEREIFDTLKNEDEFLKKASYISRLASGSAARSVYPTLAVWGEHPDIDGSSNEYAIPVKTAPIFDTFRNSILIASSEEKSVSSTAGHNLMNENPYAAVRFTQANDNLSKLYKAMQDGDIDTFIEIVELEALTLHALMMTSTPSYVLMCPSSLSMIEKIRAFRKTTGLSLCFTLDAGPNIHLLYPQSIAGEVQIFVQNELKPLCENGLIIEDEVGKGAFAL
ncbi:MAG: diphosphomevalonate/mevalonate 3,5-bisphosphate decarboxylase family protein [Chitinophagales bacterium]